jgi:3-deoxy-D-manno-octulosonate 8-phosphate phosphatase (KDO 8-P phosphatase)
MALYALSLGGSTLTPDKRIQLFGMDVDGVLSDGGVYYGDGGLEIKRFHVHDGMGITMLRNAGITPFIITARRSVATERRARELRIEEVHQGIRNKRTLLMRIAKKYEVALDNISFIGDDLSDVPVLEVVGLPLAVGDAADQVKAIAKFVTSRAGGHGAVREACEYVLKLNGLGESLYDLSGYKPADDDD